MKKLIKVLLGAVIALIVLVLVIVVSLPLIIDPVVKTALSTVGPKVLGVPVSVGKVALNPFSGSMTISRLKVGNPKGYSDKPAFAVEKVEVQLDILSLMSDTIIVKKILVDAAAISYESKQGTSNFDTIQANARKSSDKEKTQETEEKGQEAEEKTPGKKIIIELFTLNDTQVSYVSALTLGNSITLRLPSVTVRDIGKDSGGTSFEDALIQVLNTIVGDLIQAITGIAGQSTDILKDAFKSFGEMDKGDTNALQNAVDDATKSLKKLFQ